MVSKSWGGWTRAGLPGRAALGGVLDLICLPRGRSDGLRKDWRAPRPVLPTVSMDSGSLVLSAIGDLPGGSSPSEDSCLLELQGSVRSVDYVLFRSIQRSRAGYCLSLDCGLRGPFEDSPLPRRPPRAARSYSCSAPEPPPPLGAPTAARSCHRLEGWPPWVGPCFPELRRRVPRGGGRGGGRPAAAPPARAPTRRFSDSSGSLTPPGHRPPHPAPPPPLLLPRSHSDPGITTSSDTGEHLPPPGSGARKGRGVRGPGHC